MACQAGYAALLRWDLGFCRMQNMCILSAGPNENQDMSMLVAP